MYYIHSHAKYHKLNSAKGTNVIFKGKKTNNNKFQSVMASDFLDK